MTLNNDRLVILQNEEMSALQILIEFCKKNNLTYFLRGGSCLGAVKYSGMIPWDDDIDIALPRNDYEKLIELFPDHIDNFKFKTFKRDSNFNCYFARIFLIEQRRLELDIPKNNTNGVVLIDVLPLDSLPDKKILLNYMIFKTYILRLLASVKTLDYKETVVKRKGIKKIIPIILHSLKLHE